MVNNMLPPTIVLEINSLYDPLFRYEINISMEHQ